MPELPEVETVRRIALPLVGGRTIQAVRLSETFPGVLESQQGIDAIPTVIGRTIVDIRRRGKYLLIDLQDDIWLIVHLRMTGRLLVMDRNAPAVRFEHLALELDNGMDLRFADQRKFGRVSVVTSDTAEALGARLGKEPLEAGFTAAWLHHALQRRPGRIKAVLLDQHLIAGLGNIYVDEALFRSRIHPMTTARNLTVADCTRLVRAIRFVLRQAITNQGTTFSTFANPYGESGSNARVLQVYGKGRRGEPCPRCGRELAFGVVGGRGTTWCNHCQPAPSDTSTLQP